MSRVFGTLVSNELNDGRQILTYDIPAFTKTTARARAKLNVRGKGLSNPSVANESKVGSGSIPGQSVYQVVVTSQQ